MLDKESTLFGNSKKLLFFSAIQPHKIYSLEQTTTSKSETIAQACIYEVVRGKVC